jgi:hypothetical protein
MTGAERLDAANAIRRREKAQKVALDMGRRLPDLTDEWLAAFVQVVIDEVERRHPGK